MRKTKNYNLNLPDLSDQYNIGHWNQNTEIIDAKMAEISDNVQQGVSQELIKTKNELNEKISTLNDKTDKIISGENAITNISTSLSKLSNDEIITNETEFVTSNDKANFKVKKALSLWNWIKSKIGVVFHINEDKTYEGTANKANEIVDSGSTLKLGWKFKWDETKEGIKNPTWLFCANGKGLDKTIYPTNISNLSVNKLGNVDANSYALKTDVPNIKVNESVKATNDGNNNNIANTYFKKSQMSVSVDTLTITL